jgi:hypothetical protein
MLKCGPSWFLLFCSHNITRYALDLHFNGIRDTPKIQIVQLDQRSNLLIIYDNSYKRTWRCLTYIGVIISSVRVLIHRKNYVYTLMNLTYDVNTLHLTNKN